ncbi:MULTISPECIES: VOC family protein [Methylobacterium]|uniref:VOC family protein n=1 Tax=Methylobacterium TaxID=407 RepID=UPI002F35D362
MIGGPALEPRISLVTLGVTDLDRATAFYEGLGWPRRVIAAQGVAFFQLGGLGLSLYPRAELAADAGVPLQSHPSQGFTLAYNTRSRDEVDKVLSRAEALGGTITQLAQDAVWGGYHGHFCDPDGFVWEVAWNPDFALADDGCLILPT